ncbi:porin [Hydrogenophaga sp.]|uniref:porin n=1 Tax=Hydrogenophaga sp. TaxID=1904254 RepID=UPI0025C427B5|nr:porin [Hydrogenophaga sp.]
MKTKLVLLSALAAPWAYAQAPAGVTLYGVIDSGVEHITNVGAMRRDNEGNAATPKSDLLFVGATYNVTPAFAVDAEWFRQDFKNSANQANLLVVRGTYSLSKRTAVYASLGRISNDGTLAVSVSGTAPGSAPAAGASQSGLMLGVRHNF